MNIFLWKHNAVPESSGAFPFIQAVTIPSLAAMFPSLTTSQDYPPSPTAFPGWGSPEHLPSLHFSPGASLNVDFRKNQPDLVVNISGKSPGDLVPKFQLCEAWGWPMGVRGSWSCPLMNTTLLAAHFICHCSPYVCKLPLSCQLAALQVSFKKKISCGFIGSSCLGCPRKIIWMSVKTSKSYLLDWCSSNYFVLWKEVTEIPSVLTVTQVTLH